MLIRKGKKQLTTKNAARTTSSKMVMRASETEEEEPWRICVRTETEKSKIMESCHAGVDGNVLL